MLGRINSIGGYNGEHVGGRGGGTHTQTVEPPALRYKEKNQLGPATNQFWPSLCLHFSACHFSLGFLFLLRRAQHSNNAQGFLYYHSWQPLRYLFFPLRLFSASQPALLNVAFCNIILTHQTRHEVNKPWSSSRRPLNLSYRPRRCEPHCAARPLGVSG